jgi:hypothetical protein
LWIESRKTLIAILFKGNSIEPAIICRLAFVGAGESPMPTISGHALQYSNVSFSTIFASAFDLFITEGDADNSPFIAPAAERRPGRHADRAAPGHRRQRPHHLQQRHRPALDVARRSGAPAEPRHPGKIHDVARG